MQSVKQQLEDARYLIKTKRYDEARSMLAKIKHPIAEKWLQKLEAQSGTKSKKRKRKAKKETPSWLQGLEDLSQAEASPLLSDGSSKLFEQVENPNRRDMTDSKRWQGKGKEPKEFAIVPRSILGGLIGAIVGTGVWTGAIVFIMLSFSEMFGMDAATFTAFSVFGGFVVGGLTGMVGRLLSGRGSFYGGLVNAIWAAIGYYGSKTIAIVILLSSQAGSQLDTATLSFISGSANNPFAINIVTDGLPIVISAAIAWAIASSLGGVLE